MMARFLNRALALPATDQDFFIDDAESEFQTDINELAVSGITKGCDPPANVMFCPDDPVTRGQMAAFLVRAFEYVDDGGGDLLVDDDDSVFEADIDKLATAKVTSGATRRRTTRTARPSPCCGIRWRRSCRGRSGSTRSSRRRPRRHPDSTTTTTTTQPPNCDPAYPDVCIPPPPPDLDCADVAPHVNFTVLPPDPHGFDGDNDGIGCEA